MTEPQPELCYHCGQPKRIVMELRDESTGERRFYCQEGANEWADSNKPWPPTLNSLCSGAAKHTCKQYRIR